MEYNDEQHEPAVANLGGGYGRGTGGMMYFLTLCIMLYVMYFQM